MSCPHVLIWLISLWAVVASAFTVVALLETRRLLATARARPIPASWPAIAILRPCAGTEPGLEENLASSIAARYDGQREVFLLVASVSDPAYAVACAVRDRVGSKTRVVVTDIDTQHNRKVAQLARAEGLSSAPVVVVIDSDIRLDDTTLPALVGALLSDPRAGAASSPPVDIDPRTLGDHASAALLSSTPHAFYCLAALAERSAGAHVLCGALIAIHCTVLAEVGGFAAFERYLGEDFELARQLHARGYTIPTASVPARITDHDRALGSVLSRFRRWALVTRQQRPHLMMSYPSLLACTPLLIGVAITMRSIVVAITVASFVLLRVALASTLRTAYGLRADPLRSLGALLLGELVMLATATSALGRPIVAWRGQLYRVARHGFIDRLP